MISKISDISRSRFSPELLAPKVQKYGELISLAGVVLPLALIGLYKFTQEEIEALIPAISGTPWLSWMYPVFGEAGASYFLGVVEIATAVLLIASFWSARAAIVGGLLASFTFIVTLSLTISLPFWHAELGFPFISPFGQFLIKDIALLGVSLVILGKGLAQENLE